MTGVELVSRWRRLQLAAMALLVTVAASTMAVTVPRVENWLGSQHWHGPRQLLFVVGWFGMVQGVAALAGLLTFAGPVAVLASSRAQLRLWYVVLLGALLWPQVALICWAGGSTAVVVWPIELVLLWPETVACVACLLYLALLQRSCKMAFRKCGNGDVLSGGAAVGG